MEYATLNDAKNLLGKDKKSFTTAIISFVFVVLWLYVSIDKFLHFEEFKRAIYMQEIPRQLIKWTYWSIPPIEMITAMLLLYEKFRSIGLALSGMLMGIFTAYMAYIVFGNFEHMPCSCGGIFTAMGWKLHLATNTLLFIMAIYGLINFHRQKRKEAAVTN